MARDGKGRVVELQGGGRMCIVLDDVNIATMTPEDREFVVGLIEEIESYEHRAAITRAMDQDGPVPIAGAVVSVVQAITVRVPLTEDTMRSLQEGDIVTHRMSGDGYVVVRGWDGHDVTAVRGIAVSNPFEWEKVTRSERKAATSGVDGKVLDLAQRILDETDGVPEQNCQIAHGIAAEIIGLLGGKA